MSNATVNRQVVVGLGSNIHAIQNLRRALLELKHLDGVRVLDVAAIYESDALLPDAAPATWDQKFLNSAILLEVYNFSAHTFLENLKQIEKKMGRKNNERWSPREIDLDILYIHGERVHSEHLIVPHQELSNRPFALLPLLDVFPTADVHCPPWVQSWVEKPFKTQKSQKYFWPEFVGILNVTPDSFSDGGLFLKEEFFKAQARLLVETGSTILDLGAESTRPQAFKQLEPGQEYQRLDQSLKWLDELRAEGVSFRVSIDSRNPEVLGEILKRYSVDFVNDVTGFSNPSMISLLKQTQCKAVVMHSISVPPSKDQTLDHSKNPCQQLVQWWKSKLAEFQQHNILSDRLIFDPGIGFGKTPEQSFYILENLQELSEIKNDIFLGYSRKSFLSRYSSREASKRDFETGLVTQKINLGYAQYLRAHDIETQKIALRMR